MDPASIIPQIILVISSLAGIYSFYRIGNILDERCRGYENKQALVYFPTFLIAALIFGGCLYTGTLIYGLFR